MWHRIFGVHPVHPDASPWYKGALGERRVAAELARLGEGWTVLHSVPVGERGSDIDHVVIGPPGVFTINAKHHPGKKIWLSPKVLMVAGQKTDHLRNSRHEGRRAEQLLGHSVRPLIVIVGAASMTVKAMPDHVTVLSAPELFRWLRRRKPTLHPVIQERLVKAALQSSTWHRDADLAVDATHLPAFDALHSRVVEAGRVRIAWAVFGLASISVAGSTILTTVVPFLLS